MILCSRLLILAFCLAICARSHCSDSAYICIRWNGEVDKPYHEFVFYKKGGYNPEDTSFFRRNPFVLQCSLTAEKFDKLKELLFKGDPLVDSVVGSYSFFGAYYLGYCEGSECPLIKILASKERFIRTYKIVTEFFKETEYETAIRSRWSMLFSRIHIDPN